MSTSFWIVIGFSRSRTSSYARFPRRALNSRPDGPGRSAGRSARRTRRHRRIVVPSVGDSRRGSSTARTTPDASGRNLAPPRLQHAQHAIRGPGRRRARALRPGDGSTIRFDRTARCDIDRRYGRLSGRCLGCGPDNPGLWAQCRRWTERWGRVNSLADREGDCGEMSERHRVEVESPRPGDEEAIRAIQDAWTGARVALRGSSSARRACLASGR